MQKNKKNVVIYGYGNIGKEVLNAVNATNDLQVVGIVRRDVNAKKPAGLENVPVFGSVDEITGVDVVILCAPSRLTPKIAKEILTKGISTVDSYDIHSSIYDVKSELDLVCKKNGASAVIAAGWDPGTDSVLRVLFHAMAPKGLTYTNFGPGMSMGHTVCVKSKEGVKDALSMTMPKGDGMHRRMVYVELEQGADFEKICKEIKEDPYFSSDETHIQMLESISDITDAGHGVHITRKGTSGDKANQLFTFDMRVNNPALTAQVLVSSARAVLKQVPGCYTLVEIPPIDLIEGERENIIKKYV